MADTFTIKIPKRSDDVLLRKLDASFERLAKRMGTLEKRQKLKPSSNPVIPAGMSRRMDALEQAMAQAKEPYVSSRGLNSKIDQLIEAVKKSKPRTMGINH